MSESFEIEDRELHALIQLLEDEDPQVAIPVWEKLTSLGANGINRLEEEWLTQEDPTIQKKIEDLIQRINQDDASKDLLNWRKEGGKDLLEGWMILSKYLNPELNTVAIKDEVSRLANKTWLEINNTMDQASQMRVLNHIFFVMEGYRGHRKNASDPMNNLVDFVIREKKGNPVSLSMLYLIIGMKLEFPIAGIILPGYFVVYFRGGDQEFYIDIYNGGAFFTKEDLRRFLKEIKVEENAGYYKPTSNIYIILQMIRTMTLNYKTAGDEKKVEALKRLFSEIEISFPGENLSL